MAARTADAVKLGRAITKHRLRRKLSVPELAAKADLDRTHLWRIEDGQIVPPIPTLTRIAGHLGVKVTTLLQG
jgi:transcriptional regulator with XRE-family HTH domain